MVSSSTKNLDSSPREYQNETEDDVRAERFRVEVLAIGKDLIQGIDDREERRNALL